MNPDFQEYDILDSEFDSDVPDDYCQVCGDQLPRPTAERLSDTEFELIQICKKCGEVYRG
jgi:uncharacterized protein with PIN domain